MEPLSILFQNKPSTWLACKVSTVMLLTFLLIANVQNLVWTIGGPNVKLAALCLEKEEHAPVDYQHPAQEARRLENETVAVIWITRYLDECGAARLKHLVATAGERDEMGRKQELWILHDHKSLPLNDPRLERSRRLLSEIHIKSAQQNSRAESFPIFDDFNGAGTSKSSALNLIVQHSYKYAWLLEDDSLYAGSWNEILNLPTSDDVAILARYVATNHDWFQYKPGCYFKSKNQSCEEIDSTIVLWPIIRLSNAFAAALLTNLRSGSGDGHHEAIAAALCKIEGFRMERIPPERIGVYELGGWSGAPSGYLPDMNPEPRRLYHPVKCFKHDTAEKMATLLGYLHATINDTTAKRR